METIGEGGFAIVYKVRRKKDSLLVVIKVLAISKPEKPVKLDPPRSILLFGPLGTGKTLLASAASNSINATFLTQIFQRSSQGM